MGWRKQSSVERHKKFSLNQMGWRVCSPNLPRSPPGNIAELHVTASPEVWCGPVAELFQGECGWKRHTPLSVLAPTIPASPSMLFSIFPPHPSSSRCQCQGRRSLYQPGSFLACVEPTPALQSPQPTPDCNMDRKHAFIILSQ